MQVGKAIYSILSGYSALTSLVSTRIYPLVAGQQALLPYVVYNIVRTDPVNRMTARARMDQVYVEVTGIAKTYAEADAIKEEIRNALDRAAPGTYAGIGIATILFENVIDSFDDPDDAYSMPMEFRVNVHTGQAA